MRRLIGRTDIAALRVTLKCRAKDRWFCQAKAESFRSLRRWRVRMLKRHIAAIGAAAIIPLAAIVAAAAQTEFPQPPARTSPSRHATRTGTAPGSRILGSTL